VCEGDLYIECACKLERPREREREGERETNKDCVRVCAIETKSVG